MSTPAQRLASSLSRYTQDVYGRIPRRVQILIDFGDDDKSELTIPAQNLLILPERQQPQRRPSNMETCILEVIESLAPGECIYGEDIAAKSGYSYSGSFKELLTRLAREGKICSSRNGYSRADA